ENINQLLGKFYTTKGRYAVECPDKERALKPEFSNSPTVKIIQFIGHKHTGCNKPLLLEEIIVARKYIREITVERARKLKGFWSSFYTWKTNKWPNGISPEDCNILHHEDRISYQEE
ncbi:Hypothetical predicted protein, partial [Paramuricea clavata]